ncbi:hit family protein 1 [Radiomyces spectabilis]|uniref:hit family protein 1 n=1 Tax=Radiomyces spectabilis TaxID=64574 RepID=UPI00221FDD91|nr:hit family protein 1 [Radiomyces spectabilis]KAI8393820.1 hit family protein 1 [Radiomyces spectabilis]
MRAFISGKPRMTRLFLTLATRNLFVNPSYIKRTMSTTTKHMDDDCIFCKIVRGKVPSKKVAETDKSFAFMDIEPLSSGHVLIIPKYHAKYMHELPDEYLSDVMPIAKRIAIAADLDQYNVLQNNGKLANQAVPHVHFHVIPKPNEETGLGIRWKPMETTPDDITAVYERILKKL